MLILNCAHFLNCDKEFFVMSIQESIDVQISTKKLIKMCKFAEEQKNCAPHFFHSTGNPY